MISLDELTREVDALAPLPAAAARLARVASAEELEISAVVDCIRFDQGLTASVLRHANSPISGPRYRIQSIKAAVVRLGMAKVLEIAIGIHVHGPMRRALPEYGLREEELWRHGAAAALAAEVILRRGRETAPPLSFTASLLHDLGKLILARHLDAAIQRDIRRLTRDYGMTYYQAELDVLGFSHAEVGARVIDRWGLGEEIATAIRVHHDTDANHGRISDIVRTCNVIAKTIGAGLGFEGMNLTADPGACERLGIDRQEFERLSADVAALFGRVLELHQE